MAFMNIDERWGDRVEVTPDDYVRQATEWGQTVEVETRPDGLYIDGVIVAEYTLPAWRRAMALSQEDIDALADDHENATYEDRGEAAFGRDD